jgi:hypothetical protein
MSTEYFIQNQHNIHSSQHGIFSKIDHILGHKTSLSKFKKIEITPCILNALKLELNNKSNSRKHANNWRLNNTLFNDQWVIGEIREEIKTFLELMKIKIQPTRTYGTQQRQSVLRGIYVMSAYIKRIERSQINYLMLHLKLLEK